MSEPLTLPQHPDSNDAWLCRGNLKAIRKELAQTGVNGGPVKSNSNPSRVLSEYLLPHMSNLMDVTKQLLNRANQAEKLYLTSDVDFEFDHVGLQGAIKAARRLHEQVAWYYHATIQASEMPEAEQRAYLQDFVYAPVFHGSGFKIPGDDTSPWTHGPAVWCQPLMVGADIERTVGWHKDKWEKMDKPKAGQSIATILLGAAVVGGGLWAYNKFSSRR